MVLPSSQNQEDMLENSNTKSKLVKLESTYQFQSLFLCSVSLEIKHQCGELLTSMERVLFNSTLNGRPSHQDGSQMKKMP